MHLLVSWLECLLSLLASLITRVTDAFSAQRVSNIVYSLMWSLMFIFKHFLNHLENLFFMITDIANLEIQKSFYGILLVGEAATFLRTHVCKIQRLSLTAIQRIKMHEYIFVFPIWKNHVPTSFSGSRKREKLAKISFSWILCTDITNYWCVEENL